MNIAWPCRFRFRKVLFQTSEVNSPQAGQAEDRIHSIMEDSGTSVIATWERRVGRPCVREYRNRDRAFGHWRHEGLMHANFGPVFTGFSVIDVGPPKLARQLLRQMKPKSKAKALAFYSLPDLLMTRIRPLGKSSISRVIVRYRGFSWRLSLVAVAFLRPFSS